MVLPNKIIVFKNDDKSWHEKPSEHLACMPHPSRGILVAQPNSGNHCVFLILFIITILNEL